MANAIEVTCPVIRAGASTTRVLVLPKMINMNILKTLYSSTTRVLIFQYSYSYAEYSPQPSPITCWLASRARASQMTMCRFTWRVSLSLRHRCVRCIMTSLATTVKLHENTPHTKFSYASLGVWNDGNSRNQTLAICRLFQSCISNYSQQEKLEYSEYFFLSHLQSFFSEWTYGILARESGSLRVKSVVDKRCEYKYEVIAILAISAITSKHKVWFRPNYGKASNKMCFHCVQSYGCVRSLKFPLSTSHFFVAEARQLEAELSSG